MTYRRGNLSDLQAHPELLREFLSMFVEDPDRSFEGVPCRRWCGTVNDKGWNNNGHGRWHKLGMTFIPHRIIYELHVGPIPDGYDIDHRCKWPPCGEWRHLEAVTGEENKRRGDFYWVADMHRAKDVCDEGHEFTSANTYLRPTGGRDCRICRRLAGLRWLAKTEGTTVDGVLAEREQRAAARAQRPKRPLARQRVIDYYVMRKHPAHDYT